MIDISLIRFAEKERQRQADKARKEDERRRDERKKMESKNKKQNQLDSSAEDTVKDDSSAKLDMTTSTASPKPNKAMGDKMKPKMIKEEIVKKDKMKEKKAKEDLPPYVDAQAVQHMQERPKVAHAQNHQIAHNEAVRENLQLSVLKDVPSLIDVSSPKFRVSLSAMNLVIARTVPFISPWLLPEWPYWLPWLSALFY